ncbi:Rad26 protein [Zopfochytrium polystomum]|nr:Rad26 protein [Zopfochytrium polystomum]
MDESSPRHGTSGGGADDRDDDDHDGIRAPRRPVIDSVPASASGSATTALDNLLVGVSEQAKLEQQLGAKRNVIQERKAEDEAQASQLRDELREIRARIDGRRADLGDGAGLTLPGETEKERLVRIGKITPFEAARSARQIGDIADLTTGRVKATSNATSRLPLGEQARLKRKRRAPHRDSSHSTSEVDSGDSYRPSDEESSKQRKTPRGVAGEGSDEKGDSESDIVEMDEDGRYRTRRSQETTDDGNEVAYQKRIQQWAKTQRISRFRTERADDEIDEDDPSLLDDAHAEFLMPHVDDLSLDAGYVLPGHIHARLFPYQRTCIRWLWELHCQEVGGVVGDEMGLGKTVQIAAFVGGLMRSGKIEPGKPLLIVAPATVMVQWVKEFWEWCPVARVVVLHAAGSGFSGRARAYNGGSDEEDFSEEEDVETLNQRAALKRRPMKKRRPTRRDDDWLSDDDDEWNGSTFKKGHIIVTTYEGLRANRNKLLPISWGYAILDEGHKIRNCDADITITCKQLKTPHRIILSGTPIQNNLKELWSIYDFVPIRIGAYANASNLQLQTAHRCALVLRDLIAPYLLRRMKKDVAEDLPQKTELVLFCRLVPEQRQAYRKFLNSEIVQSVLEGRRNALSGIDGIRKICNHPDLLESSSSYGSPSRSGKLQVLKSLLATWTPQGHRTLVFTQTRQMLDIVEKFVKAEGYAYRRMDGTTPIKARVSLVDEFNEKPSISVFLLTTRVGGLGVNLTGADRVVIVDPDWNPSTDIQARERAWRLGQTRPVAVYRLMTAGSIEEKIYHRQIHKQFLTQQVLHKGGAGAAASGKRFFDANSLAELFVLDDEDSPTKGTLTGRLFGGKNDADQVEVIGGVAAVEKGDTDDEGRILAGLLQSTVAHDRVLAAAGAAAEDPDVEREARRVAEEAAREVQRSRRRVRAGQRREGGPGVVTWTGQSGTAGAERMGPGDGNASGGAPPPPRRQRECSGGWCEWPVRRWGRRRTQQERRGWPNAVWDEAGGRSAVLLLFIVVVVVVGVAPCGIESAKSWLGWQWQWVKLVRVFADES